MLVVKRKWSTGRLLERELGRCSSSLLADGRTLRALVSVEGENGTNDDEDGYEVG